MSDQDPGTPNPYPNNPYEPKQGPPNPYGAPPPEQPPASPYGAPTGPPDGPAPYPTDPYQQQKPPSKAMAIWALVLSFLICVPGIAWLASVVLALIVLFKPKATGPHGKGLAVAALVINLVVAVGGAIGLTVIFSKADLGSLTTVQALQPGDCVDGSDLFDETTETVGLIRERECTEEHDAEVAATLELAADQVEAARSGADVCFEALLASPYDMPALSISGHSQMQLTQDTEPEIGDKVACLVFRTDQEKLTAPLTQKAT